ncbi:MAG TPA: hypothetical protein PLV96_06115 [Methanoregulaceae archaeon]|nr:hypothetical protein [Methanoregulaceae archaeon]
MISPKKQVFLPEAGPPAVSHCRRSCVRATCGNGQHHPQSGYGFRKRFGRIPFLSWYESHPLSDGFHEIKQRLAAWGANTI